MRALTLCLAASSLATSALAQDPAMLREHVFDTLSWRSLGPVNFGGRVVDVAVHPNNSAEFYVASATGGIFKTTNGGTTFKSIFDRQDTISLGDIEISPADPEVLWAGTGEANNQRSVYPGNGIYKSDDGGDTWVHMGLAGTDHIARVVAHPTDKDVVWVAAMGPLYTPGSERGVYKSADGGKNWKKTLFIDDDTGFCDLAIDPNDPNILFAAGHECRRRAWNLTEGGDGGGIWRSSDGGDTWRKLREGLPSGTLGRIGLAVFAGDSKVVYAYVENRNQASPQPTQRDAGEQAAAADNRDADADAEPTKAESDAKAGVQSKDAKVKDGGARSDAKDDADGPADDDPGHDDPAYDDPAWDAAFWHKLTAPAAAAAAPSRIRGGEIYRSDDGGDSWKCVKERLISDRADHYFYYFGQIRVHPHDANALFVLDVNVHTTSDGGKRWRTNFARGLHSDHHALWIDPKNPRHMLLGNDGGLAQTHDSGDTWDHLDALPLAQYYAIGVDMREPYRIYGGLQDNGTWAVPSRGDDSNGIQREHAYRIGGGDGFHAVVDPSDPDTVYAESQFGAVFRYDHRSGRPKPIRPRAPRGTPALRHNWSSPIALSPHNPRTVYFGTQFLHRSFDRGDTWEIISPDLTYADPDKLSGNVPHCTITTLAESPKRAGQLWVGTDDGRVWVSKTAGERWTELTERFPGMPSRLWVSRVEPSPHDADTAFVSFTGYRDDDPRPWLFMTTDGGETFKPITTGLPDQAINVVRQHPRNPDVLFVGTDLGVQVSFDCGASWYPLTGDMPTNPVHDLVVHPRDKDLVAATHGRGLFVLDITPLEEMSAEVLAEEVHTFAPRDGLLLGRGPSRGWPGQRTWSASNGETRPVFYVYVREELAEPVKLAVRDATGKELFARSNIKDAGLHRIAWRTARAQRGRRGSGADTVSSGQFLLEVTHGEKVDKKAFFVHVAPGYAPGGGFGGVLGSDFDEAEADQAATSKGVWY
ncbi:MAG: glycosyl hydrolase [Planctomycetota bacterium]